MNFSRFKSQISQPPEIQFERNKKWGDLDILGNKVEKTRPGKIKSKTHRFNFKMRS